MCSNVMLSGDPERSHYTVLYFEYEQLHLQDGLH